MPDGTRFAVSGEANLLGFAKGTRFLTVNGPCPAERLEAGDRLIAHDGRTVTILVVEQEVSRASGADAPVNISAGTLGNTRDLVIAPDQTVIGHAGPTTGRELLRAGLASVRYGGVARRYRLVLHDDAIVVAEGALVSCSAVPSVVDVARRVATPQIRPS